VSSSGVAQRDRFVRVGVFDSHSNAVVADVTLPPGSDIVVGSSSDCNVTIPQSIGVDREVLVVGGRSLAFAGVCRLNMVAEDTHDHVKATPDELLSTGWRSPTELRWHRFNITLRPGVSVFINYLRPGQTTDPNTQFRLGPR
jgi:hypothetical protein